MVIKMWTLFTCRKTVTTWETVKICYCAIGWIFFHPDGERSLWRVWKYLHKCFLKITAYFFFFEKQEALWLECNANTWEAQSGANTGRSFPEATACHSLWYFVWTQDYLMHCFCRGFRDQTCIALFTLWLFYLQDLIFKYGNSSSTQTNTVQSSWYMFTASHMKA